MNINIYNLLRKQGKDITLIRISTSVKNYQTGVNTQGRTAINVKGIVLKARGKMDFAYPLSYIKANSNFVTGGRFDVEDIAIIIPKSVAVLAFDPLLTTYFVVNGKKYTVFERSDVDGSYELRGEYVQGEDPADVHTFTHTTIMSLT